MKVMQHLKLAAVVFLLASFAFSDADAQRRGKKEEPRVDYPNATRVEPESKVSSRLAARIDRMNTAYNDGKMDQVLKLADEILANDKAGDYDRALAYMLAGNAAMEGDDIAKALDYIEKAVATNTLPNNNHFAMMQTLSALYAQEDQTAKGLEWIDRLIAETRTEDAEIYALKGGIHYNDGQYEEAIAAIRRAMELKPTEQPDNWRQILMASYNETGREAEAVALAEQLYQANKTDKRSLLNLASLYAQTGQDAKSAALLEEARAAGMLTEKRDYEVLFATYLNMDGRERDAAAIIQDGLDKGILPADARTYTYLAQSLYFSDQINPAIAAYQKAAEVATDGEAALGLSQVLTNEDRNAEAKAAAQQALAKGLKKPGEAWMVIARAEYYLDNLPAAQAAYREAMKDPATAEPARKALAQISR